MKEADLKRVCEGFEEIERDLAFEVLDAWRERRLEVFAGVLDNLRILREIVRDLCKGL